MAHVLGKGSKRRDVPLGRVSVQAVRDWLACRALGLPPNAKAPDALFIGWGGTRLSAASIWGRLRRRAMQAGLDVAVGAGTPLRAAAAGRVIAVDDYFYSGKSVWLDYGQGFITLYIHMSRIDVKEGDTVERGATLGLSGATGRVTGPHLHWAVLLNGVYVDPELFLKTAR